MDPRQASAADWLAHADGLEASKVKWETPREGKRIATFSVNETRSWQGQEYTFRRVMRVVERTIDRKGCIAAMLPASNSIPSSRPTWTWSACPPASSTPTPWS
ncbi:hypothetical protein LPW29_11800 [Ectothiorhodospira sp. 9100]|nr:hypothetical protein [Ectothiorhodospira sp. 9100]MCG5516799.1 hypothetical protein [Ectothiorhodospira sp. 9100]